MPMTEGQWYQVRFVSDLQKWPAASLGISADLLHAISADQALIVMAASGNRFAWIDGEHGPFSDAHFEVVNSLQSVTCAFGEGVASFCKDKHGDVHLNTDSGRTRVIPAADAAKLKAYL